MLLRTEQLTKKYGDLAEQANQRLAYNNQALDLVDKAPTGAQAANIAVVKNYLHTAFPDLGFDPSNTVALQKDLVNAATQKA